MRDDEDLSLFDFPELTEPMSTGTALLRYLSHFRSTVVAKIETLSDDEVRHSRLPSGWTPLELLKHLRYMERRWIECGFGGHRVDDPWGEYRDGRWYVAADEKRYLLVGALRSQGSRTHGVLTAHHLSTVAAVSDWWRGADPPTLERIVLHLIQEYARHLGQLDVVVELAGGPVGQWDGERE